MRFSTYQSTTLSFSYTVRVNNPPATIRQRVAGWLRFGASLLDGRTNMAIEISSTPELSPSQKRECLVYGAQSIGKAVAVLVRNESLEAELKRSSPLLFEENFL
jgi:hypothetical protein